MQPPRLVTVGALLERGVHLDVILDAIVDEVVRQVFADRGTLYLVDKGRRQLFSKAAHLPELAEIRLELGQGIAGRVAKSSKPIRLSRAYDDPSFDRSFDEQTGYRTDSILAVPVCDKAGHVVGVLQVLNKTDGPFNADDEQTLVDLASQAGEVLERTSLYRQLTRTGARAEANYGYNFMIGSSPAMAEVYDLIERAAKTEATVLIQGESGTGKGLLARAVHLNSTRREGPLVTLDCTTLPPTLIENELFGHERGAFTGAHRTTAGRFEMADRGTLFIDEIGELPIELQSKLLRVIQEKTFVRVGGSEPIHVDFRLVAATNRDLEKMVEEGSFRSDLFYRIHVVPIELPPLRERGREDITHLIDHFLHEFSKKHRRPVESVSDAARQALLAHPWPGNIRELENCIESAVVMADSAQIEVEYLSLPQSRRPTAVGRQPNLVDLTHSLAQHEKDYILKVIAACEGNQSQASQRLGISRNTLARKLKNYAEDTP